MENQVTIPLRYLQAARLIASKKDIRHYLMGVAISQGHVVGCDGTMVGAIRCEAADGLPEVIIPNDQIDFYLKKAKGYVIEDVLIEWGEDRRGRMTNNATEEQFTAIDGRFPDFQRVLVHHTTATGNPQFQWHKLVTFEKVAEALGVGKKVEHKAYLLPDGNNNAARIIIPDHPEFQGAIVPFRPNALGASIRLIGANSAEVADLT